MKRITPTGVVVERHDADGTLVDEEFEVDCLIYATGFEVGTDYTRRAGYELHGRDGVTLTEAWHDGASTLHGMHSRGFPNCFIFSNVQSGFTVNFPHMLNEQSKHLAYVLAEARDRGVTRIEADADAEAAWVDTIVGLVADEPAIPRVVYARVLQQRGKAERTQREERQLRRRIARVHQGARRLAGGGLAGRPRPVVTRRR